MNHIEMMIHTSENLKGVINVDAVTIEDAMMTGTLTHLKNMYVHGVILKKKK